MRIFAAHNFYQQAGGEDVVFRAETDLLKTRGHDVYRYTVHNSSVEDMGRLALAKATVWNSESYRTLKAHFDEWRPDIVHVHNTLPLISPAIYYAAQRSGAAVVQTLHNYRLFCPPSTFYRDGQVCEACLGRLPWPAVRHACYRDNRAASAAVAASLSYHRLRGTYNRYIDLYIALTEFAKTKFVEGGFDPAKLRVKPNFVGGDPEKGTGAGGYALYVGRLAEEKGIGTMLNAWADESAIPLKIVGDGPLAGKVAAAAERSSAVSWLGRRERAAVLSLMKEAAFLVFPSSWYEGLPTVIIEAFACGLPVIASRLGGTADLLEPGRTGLYFEPGNASDLRQKVNLLSENSELLVNMRPKARHRYETSYTPQVNYQLLISLYEEALTRRSDLNQA